MQNLASTSVPAVILKNYVLWINITNHEGQPFDRRTEMERELRRIVKARLHAIGFEPWDNGSSLAMEQNFCITLFKRENPSDIANLATGVMAVVNASLVNFKVRMGIHYMHVGIVSHGHRAKMELPCSGTLWSNNVMRAAGPGQILVSAATWEELAAVPGFDARLRYATQHLAQGVGFECLYELLPA